MPRLRLPAKVLALGLALSVDLAGATDPPPVSADGRPFLTQLGGHLSLLEDPSGTLNVDDVLSPQWAPRFTPARAPVPSFGFTSAAIWVRINVESRSALDETVLLELGMSRMTRFDWFVVGSGAAEAIASRGSLRSRYPTLSLVVPAGGSRTVLARAQSDTSVWLPLVAGSPLEFDDFTARRDFWDFAHVGFCGALALVGFGLWLTSGRNALFLSVGLAMAAGLLHAMIFNGLYVWFGGPWPEWASRQGALLCSMIFTIAFVKFNQDFLGWHSLHGAQKTVLAASYAVAGVAVLIGLLLPYGTAVRIQLPLQILVLAAAAGVAASQWIRLRGAKLGLFTSAWLIFLGSLLLLVLQFNGALPVLVAPAEAFRIILPSVLLVFLLAGANAHSSVLQMQAQLAQLRAAETGARLEALRYQLNPHFLFNALTSIQELSHEAPYRIPGLVGRLADFLRLRLKPDPSGDVTLAREMASIHAYLDIEQVRFEDRLAVDYDVDPRTERCLVPEFLLMPLVENAVKYGFEDSEMLRIRIAARLRNDGLVLRVENSGALHVDKGRPGGTGVGTSNLLARLRLRYGEGARFSLLQSDGIVVAEVIIPEVAGDT